MARSGPAPVRRSPPVDRRPEQWAGEDGPGGGPAGQPGAPGDAGGCRPGERARAGRGGGEGRPAFGHHGHHFGLGPRIGRGDVRAATLALLATEPLHGYQIIQQIGERSGGVWRPSPGSVYPALQLLEDEGLVRAEQVDSRRVFHLTDAGRRYVQERREELAAVWSAVGETVNDESRELRELFDQLGGAIAQVARAGSAAEIATTRELLIATRRQVYRILAGAGEVVPQ